MIATTSARPTRSFLAALLLIAVGVPLLAQEASQASWARWRGPDGTGAAPGSKPPTTWSEKQNIRWKVAVPGLGSSSPIVWKNRVYVTTAVETDREGKPTAKPETPAAGGDDRGRRGRRGGRRGRRGRGGWMGRSAPTKVFEFRVLALDRADGKVVWNTQINEEVPHEGGHSTATQASNSPLTDGEHIFAFFGSRGIHCLDMNGKIVWSKQFGHMKTRNRFGEGASPALHGNKLVIVWDHENDSWIAAFDKRTGKELWRTPRDEQTTWCTPVIAKVDGGEQVVTIGTAASRAYDLDSGKLIWTCEGMTVNCIPTPIEKDGTVYLMSGFRGAALQAIKLAGAKGNLNESKNLLWTHNRGTSYVPSACLYDGELYFLRSLSGRLSCVDAATGKVNYEGEQLEGVRRVYSSIVAANGHVYVTSRGGLTKVIKAGKKFEEVASNQLDDERFDSSAAIVGNELYLRGSKFLYCIAGK